jgi:hypothetical protein
VSSRDGADFKSGLRRETLWGARLVVRGLAIRPASAPMSSGSASQRNRHVNVR